MVHGPILVLFLSSELRPKIAWRSNDQTNDQTWEIWLFLRVQLVAFGILFVEPSSNDTPPTSQPDRYLNEVKDCSHCQPASLPTSSSPGDLPNIDLSIPKRYSSAKSDLDYPKPRWWTDRKKDSTFRSPALDHLRHRVNAAADHQRHSVEGTCLAASSQGASFAYTDNGPRSSTPASKPAGPVKRSKGRATNVHRRSKEETQNKPGTHYFFLTATSTPCRRAGVDPRAVVGF